MSLGLGPKRTTTGRRKWSCHLCYISAWHFSSLTCWNIEEKFCFKNWPECYFFTSSIMRVSHYRISLHTTVIFYMVVFNILMVSRRHYTNHTSYLTTTIYTDIPASPATRWNTLIITFLGHCYIMPIDYIIILDDDISRTLSDDYCHLPLVK
jgi:hypothetical protein